MKFTNSYNFTSTFDISGTIIGKGLELLKSKIFNNKEEKGGINGKSNIDWYLSGEMAIDISVEELIELHKEYGNDFDRQVKFLKEELRPCVKEFMLAVDDSAKMFQKILHECKDNEWIYEEKVKAERAAKEEKKSE